MSQHQLSCGVNCNALEAFAPSHMMKSAGSLNFKWKIVTVTPFMNILEAQDGKFWLRKLDSPGLVACNLCDGALKDFVLANPASLNTTEKGMASCSYQFVRRCQKSR